MFWSVFLGPYFSSEGVSSLPVPAFCRRPPKDGNPVSETQHRLVEQGGRRVLLSHEAVEDHEAAGAEPCHGGREAEGMGPGRRPWRPRRRPSRHQRRPAEEPLLLSWPPTVLGLSRPEERSGCGGDGAGPNRPQRFRQSGLPAGAGARQWSGLPAKVERRRRSDSCSHGALRGP